VFVKSFPGNLLVEANIFGVLFHQVQENGVALLLSDCITNVVGQEDEND
jgi:hypothetical protein